MTTNWQANPDYLLHLVKLLQAATTAHDTTQQRQIAKAMDEFNQLPDADYYLAVVLCDEKVTGECQEQGQKEQIRGMAGLILKNSLRRHERIPQGTIAFLRSFGEGAMLRALTDGANLVRGTVGTVLSTLVKQMGRDLCSQWPELLPTLIRLAQEGTIIIPSSIQSQSRSSPSATCEAAAAALSKICEDAADELVHDPARPVDQLVPALVHLLRDATSENVRCHALLSLNCFLLRAIDAVDASLPAFLQVLAARSRSDLSPAMRRVLCQTLSLLLDSHPSEMQPLLPALLPYMFENLQHADDSVALEACEFWLSLSQRDGAVNVLQPALPTLLAILLNNMVYRDDDPDLEANNTTNTDGTAIKPRHHRTIIHRSTTATNGGGGGKEERDMAPGDASLEEGKTSTRGVSQSSYNEEEEGELTNRSNPINSNSDNSDIEESDDEEEASIWTLRKCSAATLDVLATTMPEEQIIAIVLPLINQQMLSTNWRHKEAGILALGAISEGCMDAIVPHLEGVVPFLVQSMADPVPLVRAISAWTLGRYASWIEHSHERAPGLNMAVMHAIITCMADNNTRAQHAACTALGVFAERAKTMIASQLPAIMQAIHFGLVHYQSKNLLVLYDAFGTVADELGDELATSRTLSSILPALMERWANTASDDSSLFALLECMCSLAISAASEMIQYIPSIYQRSLNMIEETLKSASLHPDPSDVDYDFCIVALDLIGGLVQGLGGALLPTILEHQQNRPASSFGTILLRCLHEPLAEVRQSAFALMGDCAQQCPQLIAPLLENLLRLIASNMDAVHENASQGAANNAVWALGEMAVSLPSLLRPHLSSSFLPSLMRYLFYPDNAISRGYLENVAVTIGRCLGACQNPQQFDLSNMLARWCQIMVLVGDPVERETAWLPLTTLLLARPSMMAREAVPALLKAISVNRHPSPTLESLYVRLVLLIRRELVGEAGWSRYRQSELSDLSRDFDQRFAS